MKSATQSIRAAKTNKNLSNKKAQKAQKIICAFCAFLRLKLFDFAKMGRPASVFPRHKSLPASVDMTRIWRQDINKHLLQFAVWIVFAVPAGFGALGLRLSSF